MKKMLKLSACCASIVAANLVMAGAAQAQEAKVPDQESSASPQSDEIIVEARRKAERLQDVPVSVAAVSAETLRNAGVDGIQGVRTFSPALNIEGGVDKNSIRVFIRGVGTPTPTFGTESSVPIYIDDVYTPLGVGGNIDLFSVDRVEVLNGPQGTLYGRNSLGGAIKIYSKKFTNETEGNVSLTVGSYNQRNIKAEFQTPIINDVLYLGLGYARIKNDGIQRNVYTNTRGWQDDSDLYRLRVELRPADNLTFKYSYERNESSGAAKQLRVRPGTAGLQPAGFQFLGQQVNNFYEIHQALLGAYNAALLQAYPLGLDRTRYPLVNPGTSPFLIGTNNPYANNVDNIFSDIVGDDTLKQQSHTLNAAWDISPNFAVRYIGSYRKQFDSRLFDIDGSPNAFLSGTEEHTFDAKSHELRLEYSGDRLNFTAGAFRYIENSDALLVFQQPFGIFAANNPVIALRNAVAAGNVSGINFQPLVAVQDPLGGYTGTNLISVRNNLRQNTKSTAFYANIGYKITDRLNATLGVRYTKDEKFGQTPVGNNDGGVLETVNPGIFPGTGMFIPVGGLQQFYTPAALNGGFGVDQDVAGGASNDPYGSVGDLRGKFTATTFEFTLDYKPNDNTLVYGSFKQGFQGGRLTPIFVPANQGGISSTTTPIKIDAYELGLKTTIADKLQWNVAAYYYNWKDLILFQPVEVPVTTNTFSSVGLPINSAKASSYGIESNLKWRVSSNFAITASFAWNEFKLNSAKRFSSAVGHDIEVKNEFVDDYVPASPKFQGTFGAEYFVSGPFGGETRLWGNLSWRDKMSVNSQSSFQNAGLNLLSPAQAQQNFFSDAYTEINAGISWKMDAYRVAFNVNNVLNQRRPASVVNAIQGSFFGTLEAYNKPRTWALTVGYDF